MQGTTTLRAVLDGAEEHTSDPCLSGVKFTHQISIHLSVLVLPPSTGTNPTSGFETLQLFEKVNDNKQTKERLSLFISHSPFRALKKNIQLPTKQLLNVFQHSRKHCSTVLYKRVLPDVGPARSETWSWSNILVNLINLCAFVGSNFNPLEPELFFLILAHSLYKM